MRDPTRRFSDRVENYERYRPSYPPELFDVLASSGELRAGDRVADLGAGTGMLAELLLARGHTVFAVEPNGEMRDAAIRRHGTTPGFHAVNGTAEATTLADGSVDFVSAGQAFHWFDAGRARTEALRILGGSGRAALIWNDRDLQASEFMALYETFLRTHGTDYEAVKRNWIVEESIATFFAEGSYRLTGLRNAQEFDLEGLTGRLLSSSYAPGPGTAGHDAMMEALAALYDAHQQDGIVRFDYVTKVYHGRLG